MLISGIRSANETVVPRAGKILKPTLLLTNNYFDTDMIKIFSTNHLNEYAYVQAENIT